MAATSSLSVQTVTASAWTQSRLQQAQRNAERAEQEARALQVSARAAQASADQAQENARNLQVQSDQAWDHAGRARQGVAALRSVAESRSELGARAGRALESIQARDAATVPAVASRTTTVAAVATAKPVVNTEGQTTGALISVTA